MTTAAPFSSWTPDGPAPRPATPIALLPRREEPEGLGDAELVARIVDEHHAATRRALPYLTSLLPKAAGFHRRRNPKLGVLCDVGQELAEQLEAWMDAEEQDLFPALLGGGELPPVRLRRELERLRRHHRATGLFLARIRWLADDFAVPAWADRSYQALMEELEALERDQLEHVHLEGAILALRFEERFAEAA